MKLFSLCEGVKDHHVLHDLRGELLKDLLGKVAFLAGFSVLHKLNAVADGVCTTRSL